MAEKENKKIKAAILLVLAVCLFSIRLTGPQRDLTIVEIGIREAMLPVQELATRNMNRLAVFAEGVRNYPHIREEKEKLEKELASLRMERADEEEYRRENVRLRRMLSMESQTDYELVAAEVVARNIQDWDQSLTINRGSSHGIEANDAVITYYGLVGRVASVTPRSAEIRLLNDRLASVAAMTERSRFPAVVEGIGDGSGLLQLTYLPTDAPISVNQNIITSGLGGETPKGIRIGFVKSIEVQSDGLIQRAIVQPHEDLDRLEEVMVVVGIQGAEDVEIE